MRHYDSKAWKAYVEGNVGDLDKSLMEQHMLLCEQCMEEYINTIEASGRVEAAPDGLADNVMAAVGQKADIAAKKTRYTSYFNPFLRYAAAASIAMLLWKFGIFTSLGTGISKMDKTPERDSVFGTAFIGGFGDKMVDGINNMFDNLTLKGENLFNEKKK